MANEGPRIAVDAALEQRWRQEDAKTSELTAVERAPPIPKPMANIVAEMNEFIESRRHASRPPPQTQF